MFQLEKGEGGGGGGGGGGGREFTLGFLFHFAIITIGWTKLKPNIGALGWVQGTSELP